LNKIHVQCFQQKSCSTSNMTHMACQCTTQSGKAKSTMYVSPKFLKTWKQAKKVTFQGIVVMSSCEIVLIFVQGKAALSFYMWMCRFRG
jgi:hypothetical protein